MAENINYFDKLESRYYITGSLVADGSLHIGAGLGDKTTDARVRRLNDRPYIPGSSLKGLIRSGAERLVATLSEEAGFSYTTCLLDKEYAAQQEVSCATVDEELSDQLQKLRDTNKEDYFAQLPEKLCSICQLFGSTEMAARVKITDAFLASNDYETAVRDGIAVDRDTGTTKEGAKFDYEVVEKGAEFEFELIAENIEDKELGLIGLGLWDFLEAGAFVGGNISRGLGRMHLELDQINYFEGSSQLADYLCSGELNRIDCPQAFLKDRVSRLLSEVK